ncbi:MAG: cellulase family glycosylhydrolase [Armatimonadota bacterium]
MSQLLTAVLTPIILSSCGAPAEPWRMYPEGGLTYTVLKDDTVYLQVAIAPWGPNWKYFSFRGSATASADGLRTFDQTTTIGGTDKQLRLNHTAGREDARSVALTYELSVPEQAELTQICATVSPAGRFFSAGSCVARLTGGEEKQVKLPFGRGNVGDSVAALILRDGDGNETTLTLRPARPVSLDGEGRIQLVGAGLPAGETRRTEITLSLPAAVQFFAAEQDTWQRSDTADWFPYPVGPEGVPIDLSFLNKDAQGNFIPAGVHGFLTVDGDRFVFEDGTPARFWGLNLTAGAALGSEERAAQLAERLARLGCNIVRFHHLDSWANPIIDYNHADGTTQHLNAAPLRVLDKTIVELKQRGIYVVLDPWVQRCFKAADGVADYGNLGKRGNFNLHPYIYFDDRMQELIRKQWEQVWTHVNEFTGVAYKDEPAIVMTEVINEGLFTSAGGVKQDFYRTELLQRYDAWAKENDGVPAAKTTIFTENYGENNLKFFTDVHRKFYADSHQFFRGLGLRIPINATNWAHWTWVMAAQTDLDFMDSHHYYGGNQIGPGHGLGGLWLNHPPGLQASPFGKIAGFAVPGKPLKSSECGNNPPKTYRAAYQLGLAAVASFQGWDSFTGYAFSQGGRPDSTLSAFEWETDPASIASVAAGALIFRRGDVAPARETVVMQLPEEEVWTLRWQNGAEKQYWHTAGFNAAIEQHKVLVCLPGEPVAPHKPIQVLTVEDAFAYKHPNTELRSDTGELWRDWELGVGVIDTPRTQVAYGRLGESGRSWKTGDCTFDISTPFAVTALSSLTDDGIAGSRKLLLTALARAENTGMAANMSRTKIVSQGKAPVIAEPVVGTITFRTSHSALALYPINVDGARAPAVSVPVKGGTATVELKSSYRTIFYEIQAAAG